MPGPGSVAAVALDAEVLASLPRRLLRIALGHSGVVVLTTALLYEVGFVSNANQSDVLLFFASVVGIMLLQWGIAYLVLDVHCRPLWQVATSAPNAVADRAALESALARLLNLPWKTVTRVLAIQLPMALVSFTGTAFLGRENADDWAEALWRLLALWSLLAATLPAQAFFEYFAFRFALRSVIPAVRGQLGELGPEQRALLTPVSLRRQLLFFVIVGSVLPLLTLAATTAIQVRQLVLPAVGQAPSAGFFRVLWWMGLLSVLGTLVTLTMANVIRRYLGQSADDLIQAMARVEEGTLTTRLEATSTDEFATLNEGFNRMTNKMQERGRLREALSRFLSPQLADQMAQKTVSLGGSSVVASVLFADIRGFTSLSEKMAAYEVVDLLNAYFASVEPAIQAAGGWINKFGGDSLLAVFGAPEERKDHARRAVTAALAIRAALKDFNARQSANRRPTVNIGMGLHCGQLIAGNVGSPKRMEYTVIGDVVNVASRIQSLTKNFGTDILVSADIYQALGKDLAVKELPPTAVPGKTDQLRIFALEGASAAKA